MTVFPSGSVRVASSTLVLSRITASAPKLGWVNTVGIASKASTSKAPRMGTGSINPARKELAMYPKRAITVVVVRKSAAEAKPSSPDVTSNRMMPSAWQSLLRSPASVLKHILRANSPKGRVLAPDHVNTELLLPSCRSMRMRPALVSTRYSPSRTIFSEGSSGPQISHFSSLRSAKPHGRRWSNSTWARRCASTTISAFGSKITPSMMMPPLLCSNPPHCTLACVPAHWWCTVTSRLIVSLGSMTSVTFWNSPEKFMASFSVTVSMTWLTEAL